MHQFVGATLARSFRWAASSAIGPYTVRQADPIWPETRKKAWAVRTWKLTKPFDHTDLYMISTFHFPTGQNSTRLAAGWICRFSTSQQCPISQQEVPTSNDSVQNWHKVSYSDKMDLKKSNQTKNLTFCQILRCFLSDLSGLPSRKKKDKSAKEVQPSSWRSQLESASQLSMSWWSCIAIYTPKTITKENKKKTNGS